MVKLMERVYILKILKEPFMKAIFVMTDNTAKASKPTNLDPDMRENTIMVKNAEWEPS